MDFSKYTDINYWFAIQGDTILEPGSNGYIFYITLFFITSILGIVFLSLPSFIKQDHPLSSRLFFFGNLFLTYGWVGFFWFLSLQLNVFGLGMRFWFPLMTIIILSIIASRFRYLFSFLRLELQHYNSKTATK